MIKLRCLASALLLAGILFGMRQFFGARVFQLAGGLSALWFVIAFVLMTLPPKVPEIEWDVGIVDRRPKSARRTVSILPLFERLGWSFVVASSLCLLLWVSLVAFRR